MPDTLRKLIPLLVLVAAFLILQNASRIALILNPIDSDGLQARDVIMYTTAWCPYCAKARRFLQSAGIPFTEYDVEKSPQAYAEYERLSGQGVPVLRIGNHTIQGFDPEGIRQAIDDLQAAHRP